MVSGDDRARDPDGRVVVLTEKAWAHILEGHPDLERSRPAILRVVANPDHRSPDPVYSNRERLYRKEIGPSKWLVVVVEHSDESRVITAFGSRNDPHGW